jgi:molybdate transport system regulatory protein
MTSVETLAEPTRMEVSGSLWLEHSGQKVIAEDRIALLERIHGLGSITKAAKSLGISYKTAWDLVNLMNNLAEHPLVDRSTGGRGGGGARLTQAGQEMVERYRIFEEEHRRFLSHIRRRMTGGDDLYGLLRSLSLNVSARNLLGGRVERITPGAVNSLVQLALKGGSALSATITNASVSALDLQVDTPAYAIVKASAVVLGTDLHASRLSSPNLLCGIVTQIIHGPVNTEVDLDLGGGTTLSSVITSGSAGELNLVAGMHACAVFQASDVILGVA